MRFRIFILIFLIAAASGCRNDKQRLSVIGEIEGMPQQMVRLQELGIDDKIVVLDSARTNEKGHFELKATTLEPGIYQVIFEQGKFLLLSSDGGATIKVTGNWQDLNDYKVSGSAPSASLAGFIKVINEHMRDINTLGIIMDSMRVQGNDSLLASARNELSANQAQLTAYIEQYADTTVYLPNALFAVRILNPIVEKDYITAFSQSLERRFPNQPQAQDFNRRYAQFLAQQQQMNAPAGGPEVGAPATEIALPQPNGETFKLSSLKGKYVLVDFWASWCPPCRAENPNIVAAYQQYKNKNFDILGVSLDDDKEAWQAAIQKDHLTWHHVSDLKRWESAAARAYNVQGIPTNFLIDPNGVIVARDLRGKALQQKLQELLGQ